MTLSNIVKVILEKNDTTQTDLFETVKVILDWSNPITVGKIAKEVNRQDTYEKAPVS